MLKNRIIPVLLLKNGVLVRSRKFNLHQSTGNHLYQAQRFSEWKADEIIYLDITRDGEYNIYLGDNTIGSSSSNRNNTNESKNNIIDIIKDLSKVTRIPLTIGGKIKNLEDIRIRLRAGADKVTINSAAIENPSFISEAAKEFGSQCIVISVDVKKDINSTIPKWDIYKFYGKEKVDISLESWIEEIQTRGAGEILIQSIDNDGQGKGYDLDLINKVNQISRVPIICLGGVGSFEHFKEGFEAHARIALAAANIFHFTEQSVLNAKKYLRQNNFNVRV